MIGDDFLSNIRSISIDNSQNIVKKTIFISGISLVIIYPLLPLLIYFFPRTAQKFIFPSLTSRSKNLCNLEKIGIKSKGRNFYLKNDKNLNLGLYHIFPLTSTFKFDKNKDDQKNFEDSLKSLNDPIILYCNGVYGDRGLENRVKIYNKITSWNYHVITFDYYGYGDSDGVGNEESSIESIILVIQYLYSIVEGNFFVWGHSMGAGVLLQALNVLSKKNVTPLGCFLDEPFNDNNDLVKVDWRYKIYSWIPFIDNILFYSNFTNKSFLDFFNHVQKVNCPIQVFYSNDNLSISNECCEDLYQFAKNSNKDIEIKVFYEPLEDNSIFNAKNLEELVAKFESKCLSKRMNLKK